MQNSFLTVSCRVSWAGKEVPKSSDEATSCTEVSVILALLRVGDDICRCRTRARLGRSSPIKSMMCLLLLGLVPLVLSRSPASHPRETVALRHGDNPMDPADYSALLQLR